MGGEVRCTLPLAGSFEEFHDLYREVLIKHDKHEALERLEQHIARYPTMDDIERCMAEANLAGDVEHEEFSLLFKSSREFFFAPVIEYGPLADWKAIAGDGQDMQDMFWYIKEAIDAYFDGRPFQVTVKAGCLIGKKHEPRPVVVAPPVVAPGGSPQWPAPLPSGDDTSPFQRDAPERPVRPQKIATGSVRVAEDSGNIEEVSDFELEEDSKAEQELDAFIEGKKRPPHLGG
jgi:hypothetical protein